jgi:aspartyl-tRNA(Asn)/glutamyl-tRNA(Gln) amidotransferase subunit C
LTESEKEEFSDDLSRIIQYVEKLDELETGNVEPTSHLLTVKNVFRNDKTLNTSERNDILKNAPHQKDNCFLVPRIIE